MPPRSKNHGYEQDGPRPSEEAAFELGGIYTTFKDQLIAFTAKASNAYTFADAASRISRLLESEAIREQSWRSELVPAMRQNGKANRRRGRARGSEGMAEDVSGDASGTRTLSKKARKAIGDAQRERWAKVRAEREGQAAKRKKPKRTMSTAARKKISIARKAYWAAKKAVA